MITAIALWVGCNVTFVVGLYLGAHSKKRPQSRVGLQNSEQLSRANRAFGRAVLDFEPVNHEQATAHKGTRNHG